MTTTFTVYPKGLPAAAVSHLPEAYAREVAGEVMVLMTDVDFFETKVVASKERFLAMDAADMWAYTWRLDMYIKGRRERLRVQHDGLIDHAISYWYVADERLRELEADERVSA